jgi:alpha-beta hydrolase superfamily lysophospholipase
VVISHGYGEHGERYRHTARWLNREGWSVSTMDHRGFGRSGGIRGDARGIRGPVDDLTLFLRQERAHDAGRLGGKAGPAFPQILLGHSFGGLVALLVLLWHPETLEGLILSNPALSLRERPLPLVLLQKLFTWVAPHHSLELPTDKSQVCSDPVMVQRYQDDPLCHRFISAGFVAAFGEGRRELLAFGAELDRPILLLEGDRDVVTDPDGSEALWSAVRPGLLQRQRLEGFYHEIFHDLGRAEAERLAGQWLDAHFPAGKGSPAMPSAMFE